MKKIFSPTFIKGEWLLDPLVSDRNMAAFLLCGEPGLPFGLLTSLWSHRQRNRVSYSSPPLPQCSPTLPENKKQKRAQS